MKNISLENNHKPKLKKNSVSIPKNILFKSLHLLRNKINESNDISEVAKLQIEMERIKNKIRASLLQNKAKPFLTTYSIKSNTEKLNGQCAPSGVPSDDSDTNPGGGNLAD